MECFEREIGIAKPHYTTAIQVEPRMPSLQPDQGPPPRCAFVVTDFGRRFGKLGRRQAGFRYPPLSPDGPMPRSGHAFRPWIKMIVSDRLPGQRTARLPEQYVTA